MISRIQIIFTAAILALVLITTGCDDAPPPPKQPPASNMVSKKISAPAEKPAEKPTASTQAMAAKPAAVTPKGADQAAAPQIAQPAAGVNNSSKAGTVAAKDISMPGNPAVENMDNTANAVIAELKKPKDEHYNAQGKIDPFKPLFQEKSETTAPIDNRPKRILTPLEKIELSQIRLVAVLSTKDKKFAMVEEASGKGYEVQIGTYMGKNQGRIVEIRSNSILIKEIYRDFKGRLKERIKEIRMNKKDGEE